MSHGLRIAVVLGAVTALGVSVPAGHAQSPSDGGPALALFARGIVSTNAPEFATTVTPDGREVYFNCASADRSQLRIMSARRHDDGTWSNPTVASFSGVHRDVDPFVTPDGRRLYFSSDRPRRPGGEARFATWFVERTATGWSAPVDPGTPLNSDAGDVFVSAARDGLLLFTSSRLGASRVFSSREVDGRWQPPAPVQFGAVVDAGNPAIAPSGRFVVMVPVVAGGAADLFVSCRRGTGWAEPRALAAAVNTPFAEFAPSIDAGERFLYFTSERPGIVGAAADGARPPGDIYRIGLAEAGIHCP